ncbi:hypothetical protein Tco_1269336 [Tanacetum coccineum]
MTPQVLEKPAPVYIGCERDPNAPTRLSYWKCHSKTRPDLEEVLSNQKIIEVIRVLHSETYEKDLMDEICVKRADVDPFVGIVYKNSKKERRVMNVDELLKFYDATLKRVLKNVREINVEARHGFKDPPLSEKDKELMVLLKEEIKERLKYLRQMRMWENYVNESPILNHRERPE